MGRFSFREPASFISEILIDTGKPSEAVKELEEYLRRAPEADPARSPIAGLAQLNTRQSDLAIATSANFSVRHD